MSKFMIAQDFWDLFPEARIAVILAKGIDNGGGVSLSVRSEIEELLEESNKRAEKFLTADVFSENEVVSV